MARLSDQTATLVHLTLNRKTAPAKTKKNAANQGSVRVCNEFPATDSMFLSIAYIQDVEKKSCVLDPSEYLFGKGAIERACEHRHRNLEKSDLDYTSLITSLNFSRKRAREKRKPDDKIANLFSK